MTGIMLVAQVPSCDGFVVESSDGCLGWVDRTVLDDGGHPEALDVRTVDGRHALVAAGHVLAVDVDAQEVFVAAGLRLPVAPHVEPAMPGRPLWQVALFALGCLAVLICSEIALAFGVAYLVTGRLT